MPTLLSISLLSLGINYALGINCAIIFEKVSLRTLTAYVDTLPILYMLGIFDVITNWLHSDIFVRVLAQKK